MYLFNIFLSAITCVLLFSIYELGDFNIKAFLYDIEKKR
jgi:hypothetical protein